MTAICPNAYPEIVNGRYESTISVVYCTRRVARRLIVEWPRGTLADDRVRLSRRRLPPNSATTIRTRDNRKGSRALLRVPRFVPSRACFTDLFVITRARPFFFPARFHCSDTCPGSVFYFFFLKSPRRTLFKFLAKRGHVSPPGPSLATRPYLFP